MPQSSPLRASTTQNKLNGVAAVDQTKHALASSNEAQSFLPQHYLSSNLSGVVTSEIQPAEELPNSTGIGVDEGQDCDSLQQGTSWLSTTCSELRTTTHALWNGKVRNH